MEAALDLALANLLAPMVLFFGLGMLASFIGSDLTVPEAIAKGLALYLILAIGFKGGAHVAAHGAGADLLLALAAGMVLSLGLPAVAYFLLRRLTRLEQTDAAAVAAHYGSISIVTYIAAGQALVLAGWTAEGYMVAVAAVMEAPAIFSGLFLARGRAAPAAGEEPTLLREIAVNGSIVLLVGSFAIGWLSGPKGLEIIAPFIVDPFKGILCLFLLDMGLVAGRGLKGNLRLLGAPVVAFGLYMPLVGAVFGALAAFVLGLSPGDTTLLMTLAASASYIAVPAAMRLALPEARPAIALTLSLGITFPFNLVLGIPLYMAVAEFVSRG